MDIFLSYAGSQYDFIRHTKNTCRKPKELLKD